MSRVVVFANTGELIEQSDDWVISTKLPHGAIILDKRATTQLWYMVIKGGGPAPISEADVPSKIKLTRLLLKE